MPVYSTDKGRLCDKCGQATADCRCKAGETVSRHKDGHVKLRIETKGRGGKPVTLISGLGLAGKELDALAKTLRKHCGCGGKTRDGEIEIQGDQRQRLSDYLRKQGFKVSG